MSCYSTDQHSVQVHFVENPLFKMDATLSYEDLLFEVVVDHSLDRSLAQFTLSTDIIQFPIAIVGDVPISTDYDEDAATSITVIGADDMVGMNAFIERN